MRVSECVPAHNNPVINPSDPLSQLIAGIDIPDSEIEGNIDRFYQMMMAKNPALVERFPQIVHDPIQGVSLKRECAVTMATAALAAILQREDDFRRVLDYFYAADRSKAPRGKYSRACCVYVLNEEAKRLPSSHPFFQRLNGVERLLAHA